MADDEKSERERKIDERIFALLRMVEDQEKAVRAALGGLAQEREIGRASCRERVCCKV